MGKLPQTHCAGISPTPNGDFAELPSVIRERLIRAGVRSFADWRAMGRNRFAIWGITRITAQNLDKLARAKRAAT